MKNQVEGGVLQGLSRAVGEEVKWDSEKITSVDWAMYTSLFLPAWDHPRNAVGSAIPVIETVLINRPDAEAMGAGETAITIVAAAVGIVHFHSARKMVGTTQNEQPIRAEAGVPVGKEAGPRRGIADGGFPLVHVDVVIAKAMGLDEGYGIGHEPTYS